jgi:prephenate dehydrogenase
VIHRLAVVGVGLLGGSVAKAARARGIAREILGVGRDLARLAPALRDGVLDRATTDLREGVAGADVVVLGTPVLTLARLLEDVWAAAPDHAVITDVGSTKLAIVEAAAALARRRPLQFVGSHPMAGSEQSGYAVARTDLFEGATVVVTPTDLTSPPAAKAVTGFWESLGARVVTLDPAGHDRAVAMISHLPHLVAYALVDAVGRDMPSALELVARGFKDTTRIAASDPRVWQEIFLANRPALRGALAGFRRSLADLEALVESGDAGGLVDTLGQIRDRREALR